MATLRDYKLLSFDVYGTLIDWETGILTALKPLLSTTSKTYTKQEILNAFHDLESNQQKTTPDMKYSDLLATVHPLFAHQLDLPTPSADASTTFGNSIGSWPAFPDTINALQRLSKYYKLVVLSNVDRDSFHSTLTGPLSSVQFDAIYTAQDIGSYKPQQRNFEYLLDHVRELGVSREQILQTAQSQFHDHHPARKMVIKSVWIVRPGGVMGNREEEVYDWKFDTLGQMADAVEEED